MNANNVRWGGGVGDLRGDIANALGNKHMVTAGQREFAESYIRQGPSTLVLDAHYTEAITEIRSNFLPYLHVDVIERVAYKNALRVFKLSEL